jgi:NAD(P)-dependent dehydrogenase (short-subunit alcohol dehydrogenase family)
MMPDGRTVLVSGTTGGIGRAIPAALAGQGARVVMPCDRYRDAVEALPDQIRRRGWCLAAKLADPEDANALWHAAKGVAGRIAGRGHRHSGGLPALQSRGREETGDALEQDNPDR